MLLAKAILEALGPAVSAMEMKSLETRTSISVLRAWRIAVSFQLWLDQTGQFADHGSRATDRRCAVRIPTFGLKLFVEMPRTARNVSTQELDALSAAVFEIFCIERCSTSSECSDETPLSAFLWLRSLSDGGK